MCPFFLLLMSVRCTERQRRQFYERGTKMSPRKRNGVRVAALVSLLLVAVQGSILAQDATLPQGVKAVWDMGKAYSEATPTSERICINGLWRWQPANAIGEIVPGNNWGFFKVPGAWTDGSQNLYSHPAWQNDSPRNTKMAWYQREITIPANWKGRRIAVYTEYLNSYAAVYIDGKSMGRIGFPGGEVDVTAACKPGQKHLLSLGVKALPLAEIVAVFNNTNAPGRRRGRVSRKGLCGDTYLVSTPVGARIADVKVNPSVRNWNITFDVALQDLAPGKSYS